MAVLRLPVAHLWFLGVSGLSVIVGTESVAQLCQGILQRLKLGLKAVDLFVSQSIMDHPPVVDWRCSEPACL